MNPKAGDRVRITRGPYVGWEGQVTKSSTDPPGVAVALLVFGKAVLLRLEPHDVESIRQE